MTTRLDIQVIRGIAVIAVVALSVASDKLVNLLGDRVKTLDLFSVFCDGQVCSRVRDDKYLYMDKNHLSVLGAQLAVPKLSSFIADLALH